MRMTKQIAGHSLVSGTAGQYTCGTSATYRSSRATNLQCIMLFTDLITSRAHVRS